MGKISFLITISILIIAKSSMAQVTGTFTDLRDKKVYNTVIIGTQTWMAENLKFDTNSSGDINGTDCWCDSIINEKGQTYGCLYTYDAATKYACPSGWKLPSDSEWKILIDYLGGEKNAGDKLKSTTAWGEDTMITNSSGFTALPGGSGEKDMLGRVTNPNYGLEGCWWTSTTDKNYNIYYIAMSLSDGTYGRSVYRAPCVGCIFSVRCIKDFKIPTKR